MFAREEKIIDWMVSKRNILFFTVITVLSVVVRYASRTFISEDMSYFLFQWYDHIKGNGGIAALSEQVGDYNLLYQTFIALISYSDFNKLYLFKIFSIFFDYVLALTGATFICQLTNKKKFDATFNLVYATILFVPTVYLNSAVWGQCDVIYTSFVILTLFYLNKEKYAVAFVFLGIAFAFKFQTIFILPFIVCYYIYKKSFSILYFGFSVIVFWFSGIVAYIQGRSILAPFEIYINQSSNYSEMWFNASSFWQLVGNNYDALKTYSFVTAILICGVGLYIIVSGKKSMSTPIQYLSTACWFVWTCVFFLPQMHERYTYMLDVLLILICFLNPKYIKYAVICIMSSTITYSNFLFEMEGTNRTIVFFCFIAWIHYTYTIIKEDEKD